MQNILFLTTGGTIDKIYFDAKSQYEVGEPQIQDILTQINVTFDYQVISLFRKDSLELTATDRLSIKQTILEQKQTKIIITHGTDTMIETAKTLLDIHDKTIVLTGALNPAKFIGTDAIFNIGCAIGAAQSLDTGVYIAMNGQIWNPLHVKKNREKNQFQRLNA